MHRKIMNLNPSKTELRPFGSTVHFHEPPHLFCASYLTWLIQWVWQYSELDAGYWACIYSLLKSKLIKMWILMKWLIINPHIPYCKCCVRDEATRKCYRKCIVPNSISQTTNPVSKMDTSLYTVSCVTE